MEWARRWRLRTAGMALLVLATTGWGAPPQVQLLQTPDGGLQPQAAVDGEGILHLVYFAGDPQAGNLFYTRRGPEDSDFATPVRVNDRDSTAMAVGTIRGGHMALGQGGVHVAWMSANQEEPGMFYTRLNDGGTAFVPQHNVTRAARHLDGGGSIAADGKGNVYVSWHAGEEGEESRQIWVSHSSDSGRTFAAERRANPSDTGACGCCGMQAGADDRGNFFMLYRSATAQVHRDMYLLLSGDEGRTYRDTVMHRWELNGCPMSSAALRAAPEGMLAAWETKEQVYFSQLEPNAFSLTAPVAAPGPGGGRKHPAVAGGDNGEVLLVWTEGTGWGRGGALAWQVYGADGKPAKEQGRIADAVPMWSKPAAVRLSADVFAIVY